MMNLVSSLPTNFTASSFPTFSAFAFPAGEAVSKELKGNISSISICAAVAVLTVARYVQARKKDVAVPAIGPSGTWTSYIGAIRMLTKGREMLDEGYSKYTTFKVPMPDKWLIILNTPELVEEVRKAPEDKLSFAEDTEDFLSAKYTMGPTIMTNQYHATLVRSHLTRNIGVLYNDIKDEVVHAFEDNIPAKSDEWISLNVMDTMLQIIARTSNRVFVGLPLCRNKDFIEINIRHTLDVIKASLVIKMFPEFLKGLASEFLTSVPRTNRRALSHLRPVIEYRISQLEKYGKDWPGKPNDMLSWLMDEGPDGEKRNVTALTQRILAVSFAALHTTSIAFTQTLLRLASRPEDIKPLREEVERVIEEEGWSKDSLTKMRKVDSYIREVLRMNGTGLVVMNRKVMVDYTLSDGTFLPAGAHIACNVVSTNNDERYYRNAREFDGFRFADSTFEKEGSNPQIVSTSPEFLTFGHGRHACPGRYFVSNELKTMLAYLVLNYDIKLEDGQQKPRTIHIAVSSYPDPKARVLFKKRSSP